MAQWKQILLVTMRLWVWSLALLSAMSCGVGCRPGSGLWLWRIGSCSSDLTPSLGTSICCGCSPKKRGKKKKKKKKKEWGEDHVICLHVKVPEALIGRTCLQPPHVIGKESVSPNGPFTSLLSFHDVGCGWSGEIQLHKVPYCCSTSEHHFRASWLVRNKAQGNGVNLGARQTWVYSRLCLLLVNWPGANELNSRIEPLPPQFANKRLCSPLCNH